MADRYIKLLEQSLNIQASLHESIKSLNENTKNLNDKFISHCATADDISKEVKAIRYELLKFLKWAILALITILGTFAGLREIPKIFN